MSSTAFCSTASEELQQAAHSKGETKGLTAQSSERRTIKNKTMIEESNIEKSIQKLAEALKPLIKAPEWSKFVKTGAGKERPPIEIDWWYMRAASILRAVYVKGPIGVSKLRTKYGNSKNRGHKPSQFVKGSGKIIRVILQQLEKAGLIQYKKDDVHKGRIITAKGQSLLAKNSVETRRESPQQSEELHSQAKLNKQ